MSIIIIIIVVMRLFSLLSVGARSQLAVGVKNHLLWPLLSSRPGNHGTSPHSESGVSVSTLARRRALAFLFVFFFFAAPVSPVLLAWPEELSLTRLAL